MYVLDAVGPMTVPSDAHTMLVLLENQLVPIDLPTGPVAPVTAQPEASVAVEPGLSREAKIRRVEDIVTEHCQAERAAGEYPTRDEMRNLMLEKAEKLSVVFVGSDASLRTIFGDLRDKLKPVRKVNI